MRKTIYVRDEGIWDELKIKAEAVGISASEYLMRGVSGLPTATEVGNTVSGLYTEQLDRIEGKLDELMKEPRVLVEQPRMVADSKVVDEDDPGGVPLPEDVKKFAKITADEEAMLRKSQANGQAKLDAARSKRDIKKDQRKRVSMGAIQSLTGHSGPLPKSDQARKKGK